MMPEPVAVGFAATLALLGIGFFGLLTLRNFLKVIIALQMLGKALIVAVVAAGSVSAQMAGAQSLAGSVIGAVTLVAVIGLALAVHMQRCHGSLGLRSLSAAAGSARQELPEQAAA